MKVLSTESLQRVAHEVAIGPALRAFKEALHITYNMRLLGMRVRYENLCEILQKLREPFSSLAKNY
jgi:hypothetical protein